MNWDYFRDPKTGKFRPKRLQPIKSPIPVRDVTEISDYRRDYEHLSFDEAVREYQARFDAYDVEVGELDEVFDTVPATYLGGLSVCRRDTNLFWSLMEVESLDDDSHALQATPAIAEELASGPDALIRIVKPENDGAVRELLQNYTVTELKDICSGLSIPLGGRKADLVERLADHEAANPGSVSMPVMVMPLPALKENFRQSVEAMVSDLAQKLEDYPVSYKRCVLQELAFTFESDDFDIRDIIAMKAGVQIQKPTPARRKTKQEWDAEKKAKLAAWERSQKRAKSAENSSPASFKLAAIVIAVLVLWAILR